jgi:tRNA threonylcarbamoyladenosine biosynthesis protein TsaE
MILKDVTIDMLPDAASRIIAAAGEKKIWAFTGEMGAGKTTLIKAICNELEVRDEVTSPTFSLVNEYSTPQGWIYHFDFYRINNISEVFDIGYEDYFYSGQLCLLEWAGKVQELLHDDEVLRIHIIKTGDDKREIQTA